MACCFITTRLTKLVEAARNQGRITHRDRRSSAGAIASASGVSLALQLETIDARVFTTELVEWVRPFDVALAEGLALMPEWVLLPPDEAVTTISRVGLAPDYQDRWLGISPFVTGSVLWSLYSFLRSPNDYRDAVCTAIAVGGDVDTTAAMTGAVSGARVGLEGLPASPAACLNDRGTWRHDELVDLASETYSIKRREL